MRKRTQFKDSLLNSSQKPYILEVISELTQLFLILLFLSNCHIGFEQLSEWFQIFQFSSWLLCKWNLRDCETEDCWPDTPSTGHSYDTEHWFYCRSRNKSGFDYYLLLNLHCVCFPLPFIILLQNFFLPDSGCLIAVETDIW